MTLVSLLRAVAVALILSTLIAPASQAQTYTVRDVQTWLTQLGYNPGPIDGSYGRRTAEALVSYYLARGLQYDGNLDQNELADLRFSLEGAGLSLKQSLFGSSTPQNLAIALQNRKTINSFTWNILRNEYGPKDYGLVWGFPPPRSSENLISLTAMSWHLQKLGRPYADWVGNEKFLLNRPFHDQEVGHNSEYGSDFATNIVALGFPEWVSENSLKYVSLQGTSGVMLDWWHNSHPTGFSESQVRTSRIRLAQALRETLGSGGVILANVNQTIDKDTTEFLNGVFMECWKRYSDRSYSRSELSEIEESIIYYERNLQEPKLIAIEGWRIFNELSDKDMNSPENRQMAILFTALSVVIPTNGYVLYADNNRDNPNNDHDHLIYDFYSFDIGHPTSNRIAIRNGAGYKEHEEGFIAYNINDRPTLFTRLNGEKIEIAARSGLFCKDTNDGAICLPYD